MKISIWIVQDAKFVEEYLRLTARTLALAPYKHFDALCKMVSALGNELVWFKVSSTNLPSILPLRLDMRGHYTICYLREYLSEVSPHHLCSAIDWLAC